MSKLKRFRSYNDLIRNSAYVEDRHTGDETECFLTKQQATAIRIAENAKHDTLVASGKTPVFHALSVQYPAGKPRRTLRHDKHIPPYTHRSASTHDRYPSANNGIPTTGSVCASVHSLNQAKQRAINEAKLLQRELDGEI